MAEPHPLLGEIMNSPLEDGPRLIYADWLEEQGDEARADFIRLQCERAALPPYHPQRQILEDRERELLEKHEFRWRAALDALTSVESVRFHRGWIDEIALECRGYLKESWQLFQVCPLLRGIRPTGISLRWREFLEFEHPFELTALNLQNQYLDGNAAKSLIQSPLMIQLESLDLRNNLIGSPGLRAFSESDATQNLQSLGMGYNQVDLAGAQALATSPSIQSLTSLDLRHNRLGDKSIEALAASPNLQHLKHWILEGNQIGEDGARALVKSPYLKNLTLLDVRANLISKPGVYALKERFGDQVLI
ncbi:Hypothetical protein PBC10988_31840 [Planctomycetales bacterium 10988]|nr:Hypothetical protein PBC10988_31840 [Planctomycetales bacterium 10988]